MSDNPQIRETQAVIAECDRILTGKLSPVKRWTVRRQREAARTQLARYRLASLRIARTYGEATRRES